MRDVVVGKVLETENVKRFKSILGNRTLDERHVAEIMNSIEEYGYIGSPIIVNENFEVIDGQHRLEACKRLGINKLQYMVKEGYAQKEMTIMNQKASNWTIDTHIESFALREIKPYVELLDIKETYNISVTALVDIINKLKGINKAQIKEDIINGSFEFEEGDSDNIRTFLDHIEDTFVNIKHNNIYFIKAYLELYNFEQYNPAHMKKQAQRPNKVNEYIESGARTTIEILASLVKMYSRPKSVSYDKINRKLYSSVC